MRTISEDLAPCPFCGGAPHKLTGGDFTKSHYSVFCSACHASTPISISEAEAISAWNRRAPPSGEAGEPVAWMTEDGRVASDETKRTAMASVSKEVFCIPLYRALPTIKEPTDGK